MRKIILTLVAMLVLGTLADVTTACAKLTQGMNIGRSYRVLVFENADAGRQKERVAALRQLTAEVAKSIPNIRFDVTGDAATFKREDGLDKYDAILFNNCVGLSEKDVRGLRFLFGFLRKERGLFIASPDGEKTIVQKDGADKDLALLLDESPDGRSEGPDGGKIFRASVPSDLCRNDSVVETCLRELLWMLEVEDKDVLQAKEQMAWFNPDAARRVLADLRGNPKFDYAKHGTVIERMIAGHAQVKAALAGADQKAKRAAVKAYQDYRAAMLANPVLDFDKILCMRRCLPWSRRIKGGHTIGMTWMNAENHGVAPKRFAVTNDVVVLSNLRGQQEYKSLYRPVHVNDVVRDLDLDFDGSRILFTMYRGFNSLWGVYEIPATGAEKATLVSPDEDRDLSWWDACYLPNRDQVVMLGTAVYQFLPCEDGNMPMAVLYRKDRKTGEIRQLTFEQDSDYTPSITHDGRIMYTRWEYSDLPHYWSRILMTMNPDGVGQLALWGSGSYFPTFFYSARSIPGDPHKLTMIASGHHGIAEMGRFLQVDPTLARAYPFKYDAPERTWGTSYHLLRIPAQTLPKERTGLVHEYPGFGQDVAGDLADDLVENQFARGKPYFTHPYPLDGKYSLVSMLPNRRGLMGIYLVDVFDNMTLIAELEGGVLLEAMPFTARPRPPVIPDRSVKGKKDCSVHIADIYAGEGLKGVPRGTVKRLRLFSYHYNYHKTGGHSMVGLDRVESGWDVKRILGTVDVEADGSACFEMPANTPISIQPLDAEGRAVQLMRSWVVGMPGERVSCLGCHEDNRTSVQTKRTLADEKYFKGQIQKIRPTDGDGVRPWGFANEMWPVVRRHCVQCHAMKDAEAAYRKLHPYIRRPGPESDVRTLTPLEYHAGTSILVQMLKKGHHGVALSPAEFEKIYEWIDLNAPFYGKWNPPGINIPGVPDPKHWDGRKWVNITVTNQVERRLGFSRAYANIDVNPEREYDDYAKIVSNRVVKTAPLRKWGEPPPTPELTGWPFWSTQAARKQLGALDQVAPVTKRKFDLGNGESMVFRRIPAGRFVMGSRRGFRDEWPQAIVEIKKPFWISETEVRNDQYHAFDPAHDSLYQDEFEKDHLTPGHIGNHDRMPVVRVSWNEARDFCAWFARKFGVKADLPTEAQWEWVARTGSDMPFPWGDLNSDFSKRANLADRGVRFQKIGFAGGSRIPARGAFPAEQNYPLREERWQDDWFSLNYVARTDCNVWGVYDLHGNAAEWTRSNYEPYPYRDDDGRNDGSLLKRKVVRGGSFASRPREATSSFRAAYEPWQKVFDTGFRVIIEIDE